MNRQRRAEELLSTIQTHIASRKTWEAGVAIREAFEEVTVAGIRDHLGTDEHGEPFDVGTVRGLCGTWRAHVRRDPSAESPPLAIVMSASPESTPVEAWINEVFTLASLVHRHVSQELPRGDGLLETWGLSDDVCDALGMIATKARAAHLLMSRAMWDVAAQDGLEEEDRRSRSQARAATDAPRSSDDSEE